MNNRLTRYLAGSTFRLILLLISSSILSFTLVTASPMDPIDAFLNETSVSQEQRDLIATQWDLDKPPLQRWIKWAGCALHGDLGKSISLHRPVLEILLERSRASLLLMGTAWVVSGVLGMILGIWAGSTRNRLSDKIIRTFSLITASTPAFWIGLLLLILFAVKLQLFPLGFSVPIGNLMHEASLGERIHHLILPALTLSITGVASITLHTRQKLIDVLESEYVLYAKARGESKTQILFRHGLRNIALPAITLQFASISELFGGSVLSEQIFSYPGLGRATVQAGLSADAPLLMGIALFSVLFVFSGNLTANIIYGFVDPQIREGGKNV